MISIENFAQVLAQSNTEQRTGPSTFSAFERCF